MATRLWLLGMLLSGGLCAGAEEPPPLGRRITVDFRNRPLGEALRDIGEKAGVRFECPAKLLEATDNVTYSAADQEAGRVAARILRPRGLRLARVEGKLVAVDSAEALDEFRVKREEVFEFAEKPRAARAGDAVTVTFATKGWCDVTVAVEDAGGRIVRHLASGVLGENAPEPFQWNSRRQTLVWDGKNDRGEYLDDKEALSIRVSLGLQARFEKPLFWSPHKRLGDYPPVFCPAPEGVYVFEGRCVDSVRLFDHDGNYLRTVYPFPADKLDAVVGLQRQTVLQTGQSLPRKLGYQQATLLTSGSSCIVSDNTMFGDG